MKRPGNQDLVREHYNKRPNYQPTQRKDTKTFQLKKFNNFIKAMLFRSFVGYKDRVLEIACGKGGDLTKYQFQNIRWLLALDIAEVSIEQAKERYRLGRFSFDAEFKAIDCFSEDLELELKNQKFNTVSIQFAIHYAFETFEKIDRFLKTISHHLMDDGYFFGTTVFGLHLLQQFHTVGKEFGNEMYKIRFESENESVYGRKYRFFLQDAIDGCDEFLIPTNEFIQLCAKYGLKMILMKPFHDYFQDCLYHHETRQENVQTLKNMKVFERDEFPLADWQAVGIYNVFCFQKIKQ